MKLQELLSSPGICRKAAPVPFKPLGWRLAGSRGSKPNPKQQTTKRSLSRAASPSPNRLGVYGRVQSVLSWIEDVARLRRILVPYCEEQEDDRDKHDSCGMLHHDDDDKDDDGDDDDGDGDDGDDDDDIVDDDDDDDADDDDDGVAGVGAYAGAGVFLMLPPPLPPPLSPSS